MTKPLNKRQRQALFLSIERWKDIARGEAHSKGVETCALCEEFHTADCRGCPVKQATKQEYCVGTPYDSFTLKADRDEYGRRWARTKPALKAAERELQFLKDIWKKRAGMRRRDYAQRLANKGAL